ncbi:MAG: hypothetical protein K2P81_04300 [Bacteriovoracaceae bacterium]|nr:hypothetical protein [Bacteriovoracaceae bacterium]
MKKILLATFFITLQAWAYVPTLESLLRHGANPDIGSNSVVLSAKLTQVNPFAEKAEQENASIWVKWVYNITAHGKLKLTQLVYRSSAMNDASLVDKKFISELSPLSFGDSPAKAELGAFLSSLNSLLINDGSFMVEFLKTRGASVKLNSELFDVEKRALLNRYKYWLVKTKGGREIKDEESPLNPSSATDREKVDAILARPMYQDTGHITLSRHLGEPSWVAKGEMFDVWVGDSNRYLKEVTLKVGAAELNLQFRNYILFNGTHSLPRQIYIKNLQDQYWQVDLISVKGFSESSQDLIARLRRYDQILSQKREDVQKPDFLF